MAQQATAIKENRTKTTLVVDAGDTIQANSAELFLNDDVHPMIAAQNAIGYDVYVTGNHEYNYGMATLEKVLSQQKAKVLTGNVYSPEGKPLADGYTIINKGGVKIGVIGMVTPNITRWDAKNLEGWTVTNRWTRAARSLIRSRTMWMSSSALCIWTLTMSTASMAPASPTWQIPARVRRHRRRSRPQEHPQQDDQRRAGGREQECRCHRLRHPRLSGARLNGKWKVKDRTSENLTIKTTLPTPS